MNIKTPRIIGYFFQRPESHRIHHARDRRKHCPNYSDAPLWDLLNGTFENPKVMNEPTGFRGDKETKRMNMILFEDVLNKFKSKATVKSVIYYMIVIWGLVGSVAFLVHSDVAYKTSVLVSSPLPLVFTSYKDVETFSTTFELRVTFGEKQLILTPETYKLRGSYNRRNTYGAIFAIGPFFEDPSLLALRESILNYAVCSPASLMKEFGVRDKIKEFSVIVRSKTKSRVDRVSRIWNMTVSC